MLWPSSCDGVGVGVCGLVSKLGVTLGAAQSLLALDNLLVKLVAILLDRPLQTTWPWSLLLMVTNFLLPFRPSNTELQEQLCADESAQITTPG